MTVRGTITVYPEFDPTRTVHQSPASRQGALVHARAQAAQAGRGMVQAGLPFVGFEMQREAMARGLSGGLSGLNGKGCDSAGAQAAQGIFGATGAILNMVGASQATSSSETFQSIEAAAGEDAAIAKLGEDSSRATNLQTAGTVVGTIGTSWAAMCEAQAGQQTTSGMPGADQLNSNLASATGHGNPLQAPAQSQWISGVDNKVVLAGAAALLVGGLLLSRR